jgi:LysM repeat protein
VNRKNTILLAVLINAGLLIVLFVTALTSQEELSVPPTHEMSALPTRQEPLFGDELDIAMRQPIPTPELPQVFLEPTPTAHTLPPAAPATEAVAPFSPIAPPKAVAAIEVVVKKGDTLEKIAKAQKTTVDEIIKLNHLPSSFLRVGQALRMPPEKPVATHVASAQPVDKGGQDYYTVKVGDNPWTIAMKNHIKVEELLKLNALNDEKARKLKAGDRLRIR